MPSTSPADIASRLGLEPDDGKDARALRRAILRELRDLQEAGQGADQQDRRLLLTQALTDLPEESVPSNELVILPSELVSALVRLVSKSEDSSNGVDREAESARKLQISRASSRLTETKDFRNARTLPFAALGVVVAGLWGLRVPLGITDLSFLTPPQYLFGALGILILLWMGWVFATRAQRRDERRLDSFYDTLVQEHALMRLDLGDHVFDATEFERALLAITGRHGEPFLRPSLGSKVDLQRGARDAAILGLDRFVAAGILSRVQQGVMTRYQFVHDEDGDAHDLKS